MAIVIIDEVMSSEDGLAYLGESFHLCSAIILTNSCSLYI